MLIWQYPAYHTRSYWSQCFLSNCLAIFLSFPFLSATLLCLSYFALFLIALTFPFLYFLLSMLNTSGGIHWCTLCTLPTQHPSCLPHLTAVRLPLWVFEIIPSCSGTARWCCWSAAPWHGGWHPARAPRTRSPAGPTVAGEDFGPSGWWVGPHRLEWGFPQSEGAEGNPLKTTSKSDKIEQIGNCSVHSKGPYIFNITFAVMPLLFPIHSKYYK